MSSPFSPQEQFQCLNMLDYLSDLFTATPRPTFTREEILVVLDNVRADPDLFDPAMVIYQQIATAEAIRQESA